MSKKENSKREQKRHFYKERFQQMPKTGQQIQKKKFQNALLSLKRNTILQ
jgi:hypothetical protein